MSYFSILFSNSQSVLLSYARVSSKIVCILKILWHFYYDGKYNEIQIILSKRGGKE